MNADWIPLAFFALSLENELQYHCLNVCINSRDDVATLCKNLVNFCLVTQEIMELMCVPRYLYLATVDQHICIHHADIQKCHGHINSGNDQATSGVNLVGFWSVYPEFTWIDCVQQASVSTWVSLSTFARWQHSYVLLLLARGRHCAERAIH